MKAIGNNIIITPCSGNIEETKGGLLLTSKQREDIRYNKALVESVSDDIKGLNKGDMIYYDKHAGHGIEFEKNKFTVIKLQDVVVVL
tara:strand:+ start:127 stop:387 length:261 start_codon:yes stop_codon:yes gene_type:complete